jgi:hypothetical protein
MNTQEIKKEHLQLIQGIINQLSNSSATLKIACLVLIFFIFVFKSVVATGNFIIVIILPPLIGWYLDAFYTRKRKLLADLYNAVRVDLTADQNNIGYFTLDTSKYESDSKNSYLNAFLADTNVIYYMLLIIASVAMMLAVIAVNLTAASVA